MMTIVPKSRLLLLTGCVLFPLAVLAAAVPATTAFSAALVAAVFVVVLADAVSTFRMLDGIRVDPSQVVRVSKGREADMELRVSNGGPYLARLRIGMALPAGLYSPQRERTVSLPAEEPVASLSWPLKALKRGRHVLSKCYLEADSRLGLWGRRAQVPIETEVRVYPDLRRERSELSTLFTRRQLGIHSQRQIGKGREFEQLREYLPGDCYGDIDWKATAKRGHAVTKVFQIERTQEVYIVIDASRLSARRVRGRAPAGLPPGEEEGNPSEDTILECFITASLIMGMAAERQNDLFGVLVFADQVQRFIRAGGGRTHFEACRDALFTLEPGSVTPDFEELFTFIGTHLRKRALLIFLTSLDDPLLAEGFTAHVGMVSNRHLVLVNMVNPAAAKPLFSAPEVTTTDDLYVALGEHFIWGSLNETGQRLKRRRVDFSLLEDERLCAALVSQYMGIKQRQLL